MPWEILIGAAVAAATGSLIAFLAGEVAKRTGHSRESGERAVATGGVSLIVHPTGEVNHEDEDVEHAAGPV